jgi:hypothetical protein
MPQAWKQQMRSHFNLVETCMQAGRAAANVPDGYRLNQQTLDFEPVREEAPDG